MGNLKIGESDLIDAKLIGSQPVLLMAVFPILALAFYPAEVVISAGAYYMVFGIGTSIGGRIIMMLNG